MKATLYTIENTAPLYVAQISAVSSDGSAFTPYDFAYKKQYPVPETSTYLQVAAMLSAISFIKIRKFIKRGS